MCGRASVYSVRRSLWGCKGYGRGSKSTPVFAGRQAASKAARIQHATHTTRHQTWHAPHTRHVHTGRRTKGTEVLYARLYKTAKKRFDEDEDFKRCSQLAVVGLQASKQQPFPFSKLHALVPKHVPLFACGRLDCSPATPSRSRYGSCCAIYPAKCLSRSVPARSIERARPACALACHAQPFTSATVRVGGTGV